LIATLVAVFVLSGAAGLIYESIWSRYLGLFVGHSAYAQIIVLVIFLGGMSLGAHLVGRRSSRLRSPLLWYAGVELLVGILALAFHDTFVAVTARAYQSIFPSLSGTLLTVVKWSTASALILPQSILLGATFPLMSAGVIRMARAVEAPGRLLSLLYFANSIGAAAGVLFAGFVLIQAVGLPGTLLVAAFLNIIAAAVVALIARSHERASAFDQVPAASPQAPAAAARPAESTSAPEWRPLLIVAFGTAIASFVYEIAWIRMLSLVLGSATHSFELMLSAFILGLALGALWIRSRADVLRDPVRFLGIVQWAMGLLAVATLPLYVASFNWMSGLIQTVQANDNGYRVFLLTRYLISLVIMLPATFCAGMTLPLITRVLMRSGAGERAIGAVYAVNTLGSIAGVILAGLLLMPVLGLKKLLVFGALIDIGLGVWLVATGRVPVAGGDGRGYAPGPGPAAEPKGSRWRFAPGSPLAIPLVASAVFLVLVAIGARFDLARLTSGVYRHGIIASHNEYTFPYYRDGRTATVSMRKSADGFITLATNGKPDASMERLWMDTVASKNQRLLLTRDIATQFLMPMITLAHAPRAENAAVIGQGSGMTSHVLLGSPRLRQVVTIEIEPEMIRASRIFRPANSRVFEDPRSTFVIDDAKSYFASSGRKFDIILSEPSNPWVSGVSGLFTREFYARVRGQLTPRGIFGQWLHLYELSDGLANSVLAAIDAEFPFYEVFFTSESDLLIVASSAALPQPQWAIANYPGIARDLRRVVPLANESFEALRLGGRDVLHPMLLARGAPNSDYFPVLDLGADRMRFMRESATGYESLSTGRFDVVAALSGRRAGFGTLAITPTPEIARPAALSLGARIRATHTLPASVVAMLPRDEDLRNALYRVDQLDRMTTSARPPADWHAWMDAVVQVDEDLHSGTAGAVDTGFFDKVRQFASKGGAPAEARAGIDFLHGIGAWNWPEAAVSARALIASRDTIAWIPDVLLRNGAAVAFIMLHDTAGAKDVLQTFAKRTDEDQFRDHLLGAYLIYQDTVMRRKMGWK
jgi:predicted membrane-bound spermidine synthase